MRATTIGGAAVVLLALAWLPAGAGEPAGEEDALFRCAQGIERILPGDYYLCSGNRMFEKGRIDAAVYRWELSARWGEKRAQYNLGLLYYRGEHVPADQALGIAWLTLAAERPGDLQNREVLDSVLATASPQMRREANELLQSMRPLYADAVARKRALRRYERETRDLAWAADMSPMDTFWLDGLPPMLGRKLLSKLETTAESSLDLSGTRSGTVNVGAPETIPAKP